MQIATFGYKYIETVHFGHRYLPPFSRSACIFMFIQTYIHPHVHNVLWHFLRKIDPTIRPTAVILFFVAFPLPISILCSSECIWHFVCMMIIIIYV